MSRLLKDYEAHKLVPLGRLFFAEGKFAGTFNPEFFVRSWHASIASGSGFVLVNEVGVDVTAALGAAVWQCPNTGDRIAAETFYYAHPGQRTAANIRLLIDFEQVAATRGAKRVWMAHLNNEHARVGDLYRRRGFTPREIMYEKVL